MKCLYSVVFSKQSLGKKRKGSLDGYCSISCGDSSNICQCSLLDSSRREIYSCKQTNLDLSSLEGCEIPIGPYIVYFECQDTGKKASENILITPVPKKPSLSCNKSFSFNFREKRDDKKPKIDTFLMNVLNNHQSFALDWILDKFEGNGGSNSVDDSNCSDTRGCVLADEMGLGKTLTTIAVIWCIFKSQKCKSIVVCPSSLISNWTEEIRKWMGVRMNPIVASSGNALSAIQRFQHGHISLAPVFLISYEMYRRFYCQIHEVSNLGLLVCDEGHRLKNSMNTKTFQCISQNPAPRRLLLTGTPIQNNLDELFSVLSFVNPNLLKERSSFMSQLNGNSTKELLSHYMLRRTCAEVLLDILPKRTDFVITCEMSLAQKMEYLESANCLLNQIQAFTCLTLANDKELIWSSLGLENKSWNNCVEYESVLPLLLRLRRIACCCVAAPCESFTTVSDLFTVSSKLEILDRLLSNMLSKNSEDRIVIVSNFTTHLDCIERLLGYKNWAFLRLDGKTSASKRGSIIESFQRSYHCARILLLSSKAGGVGLNITAANRLVLFDCDWNPANDIQAISRIWRLGQSKEVFIYRLISKFSIEDAILMKQRSKNSLYEIFEEAQSRLSDIEVEDGNEGEEGVIDAFDDSEANRTAQCSLDDREDIEDESPDTTGGRSKGTMKSIPAEMNFNKRLSLAKKDIMDLILPYENKERDLMTSTTHSMLCDNIGKSVFEGLQAEKIVVDIVEVACGSVDTLRK